MPRKKNQEARPGETWADAPTTPSGQPLTPRNQQRVDARKNAPPPEAPVSTRPNDPTFASPIDPNTGYLSGQYQLMTQAPIQAGQLSVGTLQSGGTLTPQQIAAQKLQSGGTLKAQQLGNYKDVGFNSMLGDAEGRFAGIQADKRGLEAFRNRALDQGPSAWNKMQKERMALQEQDALDAAAQSSAGAQANAMSQLAMRGGISGGAGLRAAKMAAQEQAKALQGVRRQGMQDRLGIDVQDEQMRMQALSQLPGMELQAIQPDMVKAQSLNALQSEEQGRKLSADMSNRAALMDRDRFNASSLMDTDRFNITNAQDVSKFNIGTDLDTQRFNSGQAFDAQKFNIGNAQDLQKFNITTLADRDKFNIGNKLNTDQYNSNQRFQADQFNLGNFFNANRDQNNFNLDKYKGQMAEWGANMTANAQSRGGKGGGK